VLRLLLVLVVVAEVEAVALPLLLVRPLAGQPLPRPCHLSTHSPQEGRQRHREQLWQGVTLLLLLLCL
jgi:hypothetical protein